MMTSLKSNIVSQAKAMHPIRSLRAFSLLVAISCCGPLMAQESIDESISVSESPKVKLKVERGQVTIKSWDKLEIQVKGELDELSEGFILVQQGNQVMIEDQLPRKYNGSNSDGSDLTIFLPRQLKLSAEGVSTDFEVESLEGKISIDTVSGQLDAKELSGKTQLATVSGDIRSYQLNGKVRLESVSGSIHDRESTGEVHYRLVSGDLKAQSAAKRIEAELVSGELELVLDKVKDLDAKSVSGDMEISLNQLESSLRLNTVSGDMDVTFATLPDAQIDFDGGPSGRIRNQLTEDKPKKSKYTSSQSLRFAVGSGEADIRINTISGTVKLQK
ncbi:DUF4097 family beta strand repeat-containing protein [Shewanella gelidii]|nr:DUF4097 family beta strand repeat-containing protein [Shewanella gelidii]MCL1096832.1 DUF4097 domain-containing protein [Shewanella gelidii]